MPEVMGDLAELPVGSHAVSFYSGREEAALQAVRFLSGTPEGTTAAYWVDDKRTADEYNRRLSEVAPEHVGCVVALGHEQVEPTGEKLRPAREVQEFLHDHSDGISAGGDTLSRYWSAESMPAHLEYEAWFDAQPRDGSRFLCPYDLRRVPAEEAPSVMRELGEHHSHVVLSSSPEPAVRLLQLFIFGRPTDVPERLRHDLDEARRNGWLEHARSRDPLELSSAGREIVREWSDRTVVDW
jgi:hypothetical protein